MINLPLRSQGFSSFSYDKGKAELILGVSTFCINDSSAVSCDTYDVNSVGLLHSGGDPVTD